MTWRTEKTLLTAATPAAIWHRWTTVELWSEDDPECAWATTEGPVAVGVKGTVKAKGPASHFVFTELVEERRMVFEIATPLGRISFPHTMEPRDDGTLLTHAVEIDGWGAPLLGLLVGRGIARGLPEVVALVATNALAAS
jgi:hypothetical protein